ncbi:MAG: NAD(P)H-hydrate dehydratase [Limisphaerales bacterium]
MKVTAKIPVLSVAQVRQWENASWEAAIAVDAVIQKVGRLLARRVLQLTKPGDAIWILAGRGHNGDDARAIAPHLAGRDLLVVEVNDPALALAEFSRHLQGNEPRWIIDGLFGIGLNRPLDAAWRGLIEAVNATDLPVLAIDVPSGLNADTGTAEGAAIRATLTLTLAAPKTGLLKAPEFTGRLEVVPDIGLVPCPIRGDLNWTLPEDFAGLPPRRPVVANKGNYGHAAIFSGSLGYHGAGVLTAHGALRARPGLVTAFPQESVYVPIAAQLQSAMVHPWQPAQPLPKTCTAMLFGPGLAAKDLPEMLKEEMRAHWRSSSQAMVVDASALDWLPPGPVPDKAARLITPHPGEAGRLLGCSAAEVQADRVKALRDLSRKFGACCVVLKGHQTLVGCAAGDIFVNSSGNPALAQGGSGDLLAGYLTGLLAQPFWAADALLAARYGVWQHGAAADLLSRIKPNWTVDDLEEHLGSVAAGHALYCFL